MPIKDPVVAAYFNETAFVYVICVDRQAVLDQWTSELHQVSCRGGWYLKWLDCYYVI